MKWSGISLAMMMFAVAIFAADFGFFFHLDDVEKVFGDGSFAVVGILPMANVVAFGLPRLLWLGLPRLLRRVRRAPFSVGFQVASWASTLAVLAVCLANSEAVLQSMQYFIPEVFQPLCSNRARTIGGPPPGFFESCYETFLDSRPEDYARIMAFCSLPPLLGSVAGGLLVRQVVRRRSRSTIASPLPGVVA